MKGILVSAALSLAALAYAGEPAPAASSQRPIPDSAALVVQDTLAAYATDVWPFRFTGLLHARVSVLVPDPSAVECRLLDPDGRPVRAPQAFRDPCRFAWTPARTGAYRVEIRNLRGTEIPYSIRAR